MSKAKPPKPRRKTKVSKNEETGRWQYEVTHPDGHRASGGDFATEAKAREAAKSVYFG